MMVDFSNLESAEVWLDGQSVETRQLISSRAALRVLANICPTPSELEDRLALTCLRATLTSAGRGAGRPADADWDSAANSAARSAAYSAANSTAISAANSAASSAARSAANSDSNAAPPLSTTLATIAVWGDVDVPVDTLDNHNSFLTFLAADPKWAFWHGWYTAMWNGTFEDWGLAFEVIKIADDVWEGDDAAQKVADEIARIKARLKLKAEIASLKEKLQTYEAIPTAGHNQGPPLNDITERRKTIELVWPLVEELDEEIEKPSPDLAKLQALFAKLSEISLAVVKYCASKADKSVDVMVETGTKAILAVGAGEFVGINEGIASIVKALAQFLKASAGG